MEHKMLWGALAVGGAGWLCLLLLAVLSGARTPGPPEITPSRESEGRSFYWLALAVPVAVWLATLPTKAPFSSGQGWGRGFLLGGLIAFISCFVVLHEGKVASRGRHFALTSLFGALLVACVPVLWMRYAIIEGLLGASLGWCAVSILWACAPHRDAESKTLERGTSAGVALGLLNGAAFATTLCSLTALGVYRDFSTTAVPRGTISAVALVLAASVSLALLFAALLNQAGRQNTPSLSRAFGLATAFLCMAVPLGLGYLLATSLLDDLKVVYCLGTGAVLCALGWGLLWEATHREKEGLQWAPTTVPPLAILVALCAFMLAYSFLQGYGVGLMLLAAWPISLLLWPSQEEGAEESSTTLRFDVAQTASLICAFLGILLLSRVFATRFRTDLRGTDLVNQFALFGFLAGAILPAWLTSLWFTGQKAKLDAGSPPLQRGDRGGSALTPLPLIGIALLSLLLPGAMLAIWGVKVLPAFFAGLALSLAGWGGAVGGPTRACVIALFAQALALALTQWTQKFLPLAEATRAQRTHFLLWGVGSAIVLVLLIDVATRFLFWLQKRHNTGGSSSNPTAEVTP